VRYGGHVSKSVAAGLRYKLSRRFNFGPYRALAKVIFSPCTLRRRIGGVVVQIHSFLTSALHLGERSNSRREWTLWIGGWVGLRDGLDVSEKRKSLPEFEPIEPCISCQTFYVSSSSSSSKHKRGVPWRTLATRRSLLFHCFMLLTVTTNCTVVNSTVRNKLIDFRDRKLHFVNYRAKHILHTEIVKIIRYFAPKLWSLCNLWPVSPCWHRAPAGAHCHTLLKRPELAAVFVVGLFLSLSLSDERCRLYWFLSSTDTEHNYCLLK
jgi:hypothetical protein